jgi:hypothetical protein
MKHIEMIFWVNSTDLILISNYWIVGGAPQSRTPPAYGTKPVRGHLGCRLDGGIDHTLQSFEETDLYILFFNNGTTNKHFDD